MSHVAKVELAVTDLESLAAAAQELGLTIREQSTYRWYGSWVNDYHGQDAAYLQGIRPEDYGKCDFALSHPASSYDIGVVKNPSGDGWVLVYDFYGTGKKLAEVCGGQDLRKLKQGYTKHAALKQARKMGWQASVTTVGGKLKVTCMR